MKKIFVLLAAMAMTLGANAQIVESKSKVVQYEAKQPKRGYNRIMFNYSPLFTSLQYNGVTMAGDGVGKTLQGGGMSYTRGIPVSSRLPMFIEVGLGAQFNSGDVYEGTVYTSYYEGKKELSASFLRINVPVAFTYRFALGSEKKIKISPFTGLNFGASINLSDHNGDYFNNYGYNDSNYRVFQLGMIFGANFTFNRVNLQIAYTFDFMPLYKQDASTRSIWVNDGYYNEYGYWVYDGYYITEPTPEIKGNTGTLTVGVGFEF